MRRPRTLRLDERTARASWWSDLGPWARFSIAGIGVAAALAIALSWYIPNWVGDRFLETQAQADQTVLTALTETEALVVPGATDFSELDAFVDTALLRGDFVRVKLWSPEGTILYSDDPTLVGRSFEPDEDFDTLFEPLSHVSDLSADENEIEREEFDAELLETYVPVRSSDDELVAVWEVYHLLDEHDAAVAETRTMVRVTVGVGLGLLAIFLVSVFGGLVASVQRRRRDAERRSAELSTLLNIVRSSAKTTDRDEIVVGTVRELFASRSFDSIRLVHIDRDGRCSTWAERGRSADGDVDIDSDVGTDRSSVVAASTDLGSGTLLLEGRVREAGDADAAEALLQAAVEELAVSVQRAGLYVDLETSRAHLRAVMQQLVSAQEDERQRIVGDIHDGLGQDLHRVLYGIRGCRTADEAELAVELHKLEELVSTSSGKLRQLLQELHPSTIVDIGLAASLRSLAERMRNEYGLRVDASYDDFDEPPTPARIALFRIAQEALANIVKHSGTLLARLSVRSDGRDVELTVEDDGVGVSGQRGEGLGMWLMRERAESLGGSFDVINLPGGTRVVARIPLGETA